MANAGSKGMYEHIDDPNVSIIGADEATANITWNSDADSGDTDFAKAVAAGKGLHYAGALAATTNNLLEFSSCNLLFTGQEGQSYVEILMQLDDIDAIAFNFGLSDDVEEGQTTLPVELSGTTWASNADTFLGLVFDTDADNDELHCFWTDDTVDTTTAIANLRMKGIAPTASKWLYLRVDMEDRGSGNGVKATFLAVDHNGKSVCKEFNTTVDRDCPLCYYFGVENREDVAKNIYIKHCNYGQSTNDM